LVSSKSVSAFCPGHITGFFQIRDSSDEPQRKGSIGSGFNTTAGALTKASFNRLGNTEKAVEMKPGVFLSLNRSGNPVEMDDLAVSRDMISRFLSLIDSVKLPEISRGGIYLLVDTRFDLPLSQGFGMSGAGLISQVMALNSLFDSPLSREECIRIAHHSEIVHGTGLGDIPAQSVGGFTIREREGLMPYGKIHNFPVTNKVILAVFGSRVPTRNIILVDTQRSTINKHSEGMLSRLLTNLPSHFSGNQPLEPGSAETLLAEMVTLSFRFALDTGLMNPKTRELCQEINKVVSPGSSMCMLGNSIFVIFPYGNLTEDVLYKKVKGKLLENCEVFETAICPTGATVL
jgi:pantoate kinase